MAKEATARGIYGAESGDERAEEMKREQAHGERRVLRSLCGDIPRDRQPYAPEDDDDDDDDDDHGKQRRRCRSRRNSDENDREEKERP